MYGYECPDCGASLDPNEKCDCQSVESEENTSLYVTKAMEIIAELGVAVTVLDECLTKKELVSVGAEHKPIPKK